MIELRNIGFAYDEVSVLKGVNLSIMERDFIGVVGANGCGKTTLLKIIMGMLEPTEGELVYTSDIVPSIGYLPQYSRVDKMFPISVREVVSLGLVNAKSLWHISLASRERKKVDEVLRRMSLDGIAEKSVGKLSGGELQRTLLARAIISEPSLLVLDEPNTYLDAVSENFLYEQLKELNERCAILLVGHDLDNIHRYAKQVISLG